MYVKLKRTADVGCHTKLKNGIAKSVMREDEGKKRRFLRQ